MQSSIFLAAISKSMGHGTFSLSRASSQVDAY